MVPFNFRSAQDPLNPELRILKNYEMTPLTPSALNPSIRLQSSLQSGTNPS